MKVGVVLLIEGNERFGVPSYAQVRDLALRAEQAGLDSIWLYDHLLFRFNGDPPIGHWECFTFLAGLAEATRRIALGTLVACTAFRHPTVLAKMATALDEVSAGRFTLASAEALAQHMRRSAAVGVEHVMYDFRPHRTGGRRAAAVGPDGTHGHAQGCWTRSS
ncbi:MAG: LLM class flavin-dependent oxidoreductase [Roseiflexaceae bacterium]